MMQTSPQPNRLIDFATLREQVSIKQVLDLIGWQAATQSAEQLRGPCPIHKSRSDRSRSFSVHLGKNAYQCFGCGAKGNQLDLACEIFGLPLYGTAKVLCEKLGLELPMVDRE